MNVNWLYFIAFLCFPCLLKAAEPFTVGAIVASVAASVYFATVPYLTSHFTETCNANWIVNNFTGMKDTLASKIHGQHLINDNVVKLIQMHITNHKPVKALVLSFHGWTGTGKNFVSKLIAEHIYRMGIKSQFVHLFIATNDFPHKNKVDLYKDVIRDKIKTAVTKCPTNIFIFDEMDKMHSGMIDVLKPYIDYHPEINGVDYRKSIFIFLSNTGGDAINKYVFDHWQQGKRREDMTLHDIERSLQSNVYNTDGSGLWHSDLISKNLITELIPFLPLELTHVKKCIKDDMESKGYIATESEITQVAELLQYFPEDTKHFSTSGCKRVSQKVDFVFSDFL